MRTLVALTVLMLALAGAVWWKTSAAGAGAGEGAPPTDPGMGRLTMGVGDALGRVFDPEPQGSEPSEAGLGGGEAAGPQEAGGAQAAPPPQPEPRPEPQPEPAPRQVRHVVKSGETMYRIVLNAYGTAPQELIRKVADANGIADPADIDEGRALTLPEFEGYPAPSAG